jgi:hypothetical protein
VARTARATGRIAAIGGGLVGYLTVWVVRGVTVLIAAGALVVVPRLAFSDAPDAADPRSVTPATDPAPGGQA